MTDLAGYEELKRVNEELRQARRAALNLMEDAILSQEALRINEHRIRRQNETLQAAINGASLADSLNIMVRLVMEETEARTAFYLVNENHTCLHPVWGAGNMPDGYLKQVDAFKIGEDSFACGLAVAAARPVITPDVRTEPLWKQWTAIAEQYKFRGCWSFPISARDHRVVGTFAIYFAGVREATPTELALAEMVTQTAGVIISGHLNAQARLRAEAALRQSEARFRTLANAVPQVIWANDAEGRANYFNQRWYEYSGLSYEASYGIGWEAMVHPDDARTSKDKWKKALVAGEIFDTEFRLRRHDGNYRWFIGRNVPVKDPAGNITGWFGSATDIDDLKKTEEALSQSEARLRITMESASDYAIITMDTSRNVERWSKGAEELFGYTEAEMIGQPADVIFTEEDRAAGAPQQEMETARDNGRAADERWHRRKDGSRFFASGVMRPIQSKELTGYVKVMRDMTQQQLFTQELHRLVAERTVELQRSNEDLRQFAHVASHDLKEPIRKIQTFNNRILDEYGEQLPPKAKVFAQKIGVSADRMVQMIEGVLRYSKLGAEEQVWESVDLGEVIQHIRTDLEVLIQQKGAVINTTDLPTITANATLMYQLFYNLILNALKFSKKAEPPRISIRWEQAEEAGNLFNKITVTDNGIGFEEEFAEDIFKTFTRLHPAEDYEGTGLGLALCKKIVERHGGRIWAQGEPGKGATFSILLPLKKG